MAHVADGKVARAVPDDKGGVRGRVQLKGRSAALVGLVGAALTFRAHAHPEDEICPQEWQDDMASPCRPGYAFDDVPDMDTAQSFTDVLGVFAADGVAHILPAGSDHILFVVALTLASTGVWALVGRLTLFTLAHTLALALAVIGGVRVPESVVGPLITLSIVGVALAGLFGFKVKGAGGRAAGGLVILLFGLFHGMGFAAALSELGMSREVLVPALIGFNLGVEAGQLAVVAGVLVLAHMVRTGLAAAGAGGLYPRVFGRPLLAVIAVTALVWTGTLLLAAR